jgi:hypothetical protein
MFSDSFAGIAPSSVAGFVVAQGVGALIGLGLQHALGVPRAELLKTVAAADETAAAKLH